MNEPANDESAPEFSDSDQQWFAALTGRTPATDATTPAAREGIALRIALEQRRQEAATGTAVQALTTPEAMQRQLERLQQRVAREGIFDRAASTPPPRPDSPSPVIAFPWWRRRRALLAAAACVLVAVGVIPRLTNSPRYPLPSQMAGADGVQETRAAQPREAAEHLAQQLRQAGLKPGLYQRGETFFVDVTLLASELADAAPGFKALGLTPAPGFNRVAISPT